MNRLRHAWLAAGAVAVLTVVAVQARAEDSPQIQAGRALAKRHCGGCHAVESKTSPLADAPPFRDLHLRYRAGDLPRMLALGMLPPDRPPEEGSRVTHPRMPSANLDADEVAELTAYVRSLDPRP
jgi:mono/diheme cytochrome c family protein